MNPEAPSALRATAEPREAAPPPPTATAHAPPGRLTSLDVFRGFTMLFMASEIMRIPQVARTFTDSAPAQWLAWSLAVADTLLDVPAEDLPAGLRR